MSTSIKNIPIEQIAAKYQELGSVWKVGEFFGVPGQTVHKELKKAGLVKPMNVFSEEDKAKLRELYLEYRDRGELQKLADMFGRTKNFICRKAKELGLTDQHRGFDFSEEKRTADSNRRKEWFKTHEHPRGFSGHKHTKESREKMGEASLKFWSEHYDEMHTDELRRKRSDLTMKMLEEGIIGVRSRSLVEEVTVGGKTFTIKSSWEYDIALYLEYLKENGLITEWLYEPKKFVFKYNTLGVRTYKPDFSVTRGDRVYYLEVKGWQDKKYEIKRKLMREEFPDIKLIYILKEQYFAIEHKHACELPGWGSFREIAGSKKKKLCLVNGCNEEVIAKGLCRHHYYEKYQKRKKLLLTL